jgi:hypothetical protein
VSVEELPPFQTDDEPIDEPIEAAPDNVLEALKAQRAKHAEPKTYDVVVPGWGELLVLRLGAITGQQQTRLVERVRTKGVTAFYIDQLVAAYRQTLGRTTPDGPLLVLSNPDGDPVGLDRQLADMLELGPVMSARDVLVRLFSKANSPQTAIAAVAAEWSDWAREGDEDIDDAFVGES